MYHILETGRPYHLATSNPAVIVVPIVGRGTVCVTMARHDHSPELFAALDGQPYGFWVGTDPDDPQWIVLRADQVLVVHAGTWHHGPIPLESPNGTYLFVSRAGTDAEDVKLHELSHPRHPPL